MYKYNMLYTIKFIEHVLTPESCYTKKTPEIPMSLRRRDRIRTCDFYVPNVALYQAEPHAADRYANTEQEKFQLVFEKIHNIFLQKNPKNILTSEHI